jgi:hypothetical protein
MNRSVRVGAIAVAACLWLALGSQALAVSTSNRILEFTYTSFQYGSLGSFTMRERDLLNNIGDPHAGYVSNQFILDLNFSYSGLSWTKSHIDQADQTIYDVSRPLPHVNGGNGSLAQLPSIPGRSGAITIFHPDVGTEFGDALLPGQWSTSVVPEPGGCVLVALAIIGGTSAGRSRLFTRVEERGGGPVRRG